MNKDGNVCNRNPFSDCVYSHRVLQRKTLREVAKDIGVSAAYLSEIERGKRFPVKGQVVSKIADYYDIKKDDLLSLIWLEMCNRESCDCGQREFDFFPHRPMLSACKRGFINKNLHDVIVGEQLEFQF